MQHGSVIRLALLMVLVLSLAGAVALNSLCQSQKNIEEAQQKRFEYTRSAAQISVLSGLLSTRIRNYTYTGSEQALTLYYQAQAITAGHLPRIDGRIISDERLLQSMMLTREEQGLLERARQATLTLFRLEEEAMRLMNMGNVHQARLKVFNADYDRYRDVVTESVSQFTALLQTRLDDNIEQKRAQNRQSTTMVIVIFVLLVLLLLAVLWRFSGSKGITQPVILSAGHRSSW